MVVALLEIHMWQAVQALRMEQTARDLRRQYTKHMVTVFPEIPLPREALAEKSAMRMQSRETLSAIRDMWQFI